MQIVNRIEAFDGATIEERHGVTDPLTIVKGYYGYKYYRKPINRDYGSNLITNFNGSVVAGSSTITALHYEFDSVSGQDGLEIRVGDEITDGVVYNPILNEFYWASLGKGSWCNNKRLRVSKRHELTNCLIGTGIPFGDRIYEKYYN